MNSAQSILAQGGGNEPPGGQGGPPPGGYGPPGSPPGGYGPPGSPPGGYGPPGAPPGGYGPPGAPYGMPLPPAGGAQFGGPMPSPSPELKKQATTWLIISGVSLVVCGCCFGLIGGAFCYMAMQAADRGNIADAQSKLKWGKIITVLGFVAGIIVSGIATALYAANIVALFASH